MRVVHDFHGGIHPPASKRQSTGTPIRHAGIPAELVLPLLSCGGALLEACVEVGARVLKGQRIATAADTSGAPLHAPTSGEVVAIEPHPIAHPSGLTTPCLILRGDDRDEWIDHRGIDDYTKLPHDQLLQIIRDAGITGLGGAGFPTAVKLATHGKPIDTLILNGAECEPYASADDLLMRERAAQVIDGARILRHLLQPRETLLGIEDDKPEAIAALRQAAAGSDIEIVVFPARYPSGGERQLIQLLTGREVPSGGLPADIGVLCQNVATAAAVHRAVVHGEPLLSRITTITGDACREPRNYEVLFGTPLRHLLAQSGYDAARCSRLIVGGPLTGFTIDSDAVPVVETSHCIIAATATEMPEPPPPQPCIRCGFCAEVCPATLLPQQLYTFARTGDREQLEAHHLFDCIECGACAYVCPSRIPLVQHYRNAKGELLARDEQRRRADHARARFEARNQRLARDAQEREIRRRQRLDVAATAPVITVAAPTKPAPVDVVKAAVERAKARKAAQKTDPPATLSTGAESDPKQQLPALYKKLANAEQRLQEVREQYPAKLPHFEEAVALLRERIATAETAARNATPAADDAAQAAIARALTTHARRTRVSPLEQADQAIAALEKRIAKARYKLAQTERDGDASASLHDSALRQLEQKLEQARRERDALAERH